MTTTPISSVRSGSFEVPLHASKLRWRAILAGATATLATQIVLMMLGAGLGFAVYNPTQDSHAMASFGAGAAVIQGITAVLSLWVGGWIAGRFMRNAGERAGRLHGFMVWCVATIVAVAILSTGIGWAIGGLGNMVGRGLSMAGKPAIDGMAEMVKSDASKNQTLFGSFTDEGLSAPAIGKTLGETLRAKRDISYAVTKLFTASDSDMATNKKSVVTLLIQNQGLTGADANKMVDTWVASYQIVKADSETAMRALVQKTREAAEASANVLSVLSLCYFAAFIIGAVAACHGGTHGAQRACRHHCKADIIPSR